MQRGVAALIGCIYPDTSGKQAFDVLYVSAFRSIEQTEFARFAFLVFAPWHSCIFNVSGEGSQHIGDGPIVGIQRIPIGSMTSVIFGVGIGTCVQKETKSFIVTALGSPH